MSVDLYAVLCTRDYERAEAWYSRFFGSAPSYVASDTECVWELAESRCFVLEQQAERAGHGVVTVFVDDFDARLASISARGIEPLERLTYGNGVRKAFYRDLDGNEFGLGGGPATV